MKYVLIFITFFLANFLLASCSFQLSFFKEVNKANLKKNVLISPLSAYQVFGLTSNGAKGTTLEQMLLALGNKSLEELNQINKEIINLSKQFSTLELANAIMTLIKPKQSFLDAAALYEATVEPLKNVAQINNWCNLKTHGTIQKIIDELPGDTIMVLLNAVYFKGAWKTEFDEEKTSKQLFYNFNNENESKKVDTMKVTEVYNYYSDKDLQIVELPYTKDSMSAVILLPSKDKNINDFISELDDEKLQKLLKRMYPTKINLLLPKFKLETEYTLNNVLKTMGMKVPFQGNADFTGIAAGSMHISLVIQKSYLAVDEKGTEASSVTAVIISKGIDHTPSMVINRPFIFMLRNKNFPNNYEMLFISKVEKLE